ncbi:MAG: hypothetical protein KHZ27_09910 [Fusobacterium sp.]|nr:hypothetical protein [Fusobacterium sp.]
MAKMSLEEKMAERMAARKVEEQNKNDLVIIQENSLILPDKKDLRELSYFDEITDKEEIRELLKENSIKILGINAKASLELGELFSNLEKELSKKGSPEGVYTKFLEFNGYNRMTALRHRHRYELYIETKNEKSKKLIAALSTIYIEKAYRYKNEIKEFLEEGLTLQDLKDLIDTKFITQKKDENKKSEELEITTLRINKIFSSFRKITVMDDKKKERLDEILDELENLLKEEN